LEIMFFIVARRGRWFLVCNTCLYFTVMQTYWLWTAKQSTNVAVELVFIRDGCFTFNNSTYFTTSDVTSFIEGISTNKLAPNAQHFTKANNTPASESIVVKTKRPSHLDSAERCW